MSESNLSRSLLPTPEQVQQLPFLHRATVPADYLDAMGHMNIMWYVHLFDNGAWELFDLFGMNLAYYKQSKAGAFALEQHINYYAEVLVAQTVAVYGRIIGRSSKRVHFMLFMHNETTDRLAASFEVIGGHADLTERRLSPYPVAIANKIDQLQQNHAELTWLPPLSGVMRP